MAHENAPGWGEKTLQLITGAKAGEARQVFSSFLALNFLLISYYMIKPLRNSTFLKDFDPNYLPFVYLVVPMVSLAVTKLFNYMADRMDKYRLVTSAYLVIMALKVAFTWILPNGGRPATIVFYFFASVYFLLAIATLWACVNDIFTSEQSERCYGFVAVGATLGNVVGAKLSAMVAGSAWRDYATIVSAASMGVALFFILLAASQRRQQREEEAAAQPQAPAEEEEKKQDFWSDIRSLIADSYVRRIGIMVVCLAVYTTALDFLSQQVIDQRLSEAQYKASFVDVNRAFNARQGLEEGKLNAEGYQFIYSLKSMSDEERAQKLETLGEQIGVSDLEARYAEYQEELEGNTRKLFSNVFLYQGFLGIFLLTVVARPIFAKLGLRVAVILMPILAGFSLVAFCFPVELLFVQAFLVLSGSMNYSLNNASKEILYTVTSEETKFKHKPLIEGPGMRLGDVTASIVKILLFLGLGALGFSQAQSDQLFLGIVFVLVVIWLRSIYLAGKTYDDMRKQREEDRE